MNTTGFNENAFHHFRTFLVPDAVDKKEGETAIRLFWLIKAAAISLAIILVLNLVGSLIGKGESLGQFGDFLAAFLTPY